VANLLSNALQQSSHHTHVCSPARPLAQLDFLIHLLDVTGPALDAMVRVLNFMRRMLPIDVSTVQGATTVYTKPKGTTGMQANSTVLMSKALPGSEPNNGAPPAPSAPAVRVTAVPRATPSGRRLLGGWL
jgi:hypothetical protein